MDNHIDIDIVPKKRNIYSPGVPLHREKKKKKNFRDWVKIEGICELKVICSQKDGCGKRLRFFRSHRDKRVGQCVYTVISNLIAKRC